MKIRRCQGWVAIPVPNHLRGATPLIRQCGDPANSDVHHGRFCTKHGNQIPKEWMDQPCQPT